MPPLLRTTWPLLRTLRRSPSFFITTILTLALGMALTLVMFTVVRGFILKPLAYPHANRMVRITTQHGGRNWNILSLPDVLEIQAQASTLENLAYLSGGSRSQELGGFDRARTVQAWPVSWNLLSLLGAQPVQGRFFSPAEERDHLPMAVLTHAFWQQQFGSDPKVIGKLLLLDGKAYTILGVAPSDLVLPLPGSTDCFTTLPPNSDTRQSFWLRAIGLRKPGASLTQLQADLQRIGTGLVEKYPAEETGWTYSAQDLHTFLLKDRQTTLLLLMGASGLVLLIACANVANLFLARALQRRQEHALRAALGASPFWRLRHHLTEGLVVGLSAGALGSLLTFGAIHILPRTMPDLQTMAGAPKLAVDPAVLGVALILSLCTSLSFALVPMAQIREAGLADALQAGGRSHTGFGHRTRRLLLMLQSALAVLALSLGGLFFHSFQKVLSIDPGFRYRGLLSFHLDLPESRYASPEARGRFQADLLQNLRDLSGQPAVAVSTAVPFGGHTNSMRSHEVPTQQPDSAWPITLVEGVSDGYFQTLGIPMLIGRPIQASDSNHGPRVAVINEACAKVLFQGENPVGRRLALTVGTPDRTEYDIVGVCQDTRQAALFQAPEPRIFYPNQQLPTAHLNVLLRSEASPDAMQNLLEDRVRSLDPSLPLRDLERVENLGRDQIGNLEQTLRLLGLFAVLGLAITTFGIYSVMSHHMEQRRREIGIRMALGADRGNILWMALQQGFWPSLAGALLGTLAAWTAGRLMQNQLIEVSALDPLAMAFAWTTLGLAGALATLLPSLRILRLQTIQALRED